MYEQCHSGEPQYAGPRCCASGLACKRLSPVFGFCVSANGFDTRTGLAASPIAVAHTKPSTSPGAYAHAQANGRAVPVASVKRNTRALPQHTLPTLQTQTTAASAHDSAHAHGQPRAQPSTSSQSVAKKSPSTCAGHLEQCMGQKGRYSGPECCLPGLHCHAYNHR